MLYTGATSANKTDMVSALLKPRAYEKDWHSPQQQQKSISIVINTIKKQYRVIWKHLARKLDLRLKRRLFQAERITSENALRWETCRSSLRNQKQCLVGTKIANGKQNEVGLQSWQAARHSGSLRPCEGFRALFWEQGEVFKDYEKGDDMT